MTRRLLLAVLIIGLSQGTPWMPERSDDQCDVTMQEVVHDDRASVVNNAPERLHATWLSQECELKAGPEYVIRKYTFFENGTFLLLRNHYAEESCSVATHTVTARGSIRLLSESVLTKGATTTKFSLDTVHIVPLNRQVAQKFGHRLNVTCSLQPRWRPYVAHLVYEQPLHRLSNPHWLSSRYNSLQGHASAKTNHGIDCLEQLNIEFSELRLVRVQRKTTSARSYLSNIEQRTRVELLLGSLPPNPRTKWTHRLSSLQPTALLRSDTVNGCPICGSISRGTEYSPPLLHEVAALPALLGGFWISTSCESAEGGLWVRRQLQMFSGDKLWTGRWDYHEDARCTEFLYAVTAAGSYVQRPGRARRHGELAKNLEAFFEPDRDDSFHKRLFKRSLTADERVQRGSKNLAEWMTPQLARELVNMYRSEHPKLENMLPTDEEFREALTKSRDSTDRFDPENSLLHNEDTTTTESNNANTIEDAKSEMESTEKTLLRSERSLDDSSYQHLLKDAQPSMAESIAAMLRGNQRYEETTRRPSLASLPLGTTELDLHVAESLLIPGDVAIAARCGGQKNRPLVSWPRNCVVRALNAPSTIGLRARVGVSWTGQYTLLLGPRDDHLWEAPIQQCGSTPSYNPALRAHLRRSVGISYGLFSGSSAARSSGPLTSHVLISFVLFFFLR